MYSDEIDYQLTDWLKPKTKVSTTEGVMYYSTWLKVELKRILKDDRRVAEIREGGATDNRLSLWVNRFQWNQFCHCGDCEKFDPIDLDDRRL